MKKIWLFIFTIIISFVYCVNVFASTFSAYVAGNNVSLRTGPSTNEQKLIGLNYGAILELYDLTLYKGDGCSAGWYKVKYSTYNGYMCSTYVAVNNTTSVVTDNTEPSNEYEVYLKSIGFPASYWGGLSYLHDLHPNWIFKPNVLTIDWYAALNAQYVDGKSLISGSSTGYRSTDSSSYNFLTDTFVQKEAGWYNASEETISYYMDPRNWLTESYIFQFEDLIFHSEYQKLEVIQSVFTTTANPNGTLKANSANFLNAAVQSMDGKNESISPVHLASRARQELGMSDNNKPQMLGTSTSIYRGFLLTGYFNYFNIGSYADSYTSSPSTRGMAYAAGKDCIGCGFDNTYGRPWNTASKAISGGAQFLINKYLLKGQNTIYYQRYNAVSSNPFTNQYMTNVAAPSSEGLITANAYKDNSLQGEAIVFNIPIYINMPTKISSKPNPGSPNNHLKELTVNGNIITNFSHDKYIYDISLSPGTTSILVNGSTVNSSAKISGAGTITVEDNKKVVLTVTAENGTVQNYTLNLTITVDNIMKPADIVKNASIKSNDIYIYALKEGTTATSLTSALLKVCSVANITIKDIKGNIKTSAAIASGDVLTVSNNNEVKSYTLSVAGDASGDGKVTLIDLLKVQKHIVGESPLTNAYFLAGDVNNDGKITIVDLLKVQKYILGISEF